MNARFLCEECSRTVAESNRHTDPRNIENARHFTKFLSFTSSFFVKTHLGNPLLLWRMILWQIISFTVKTSPFSAHKRATRPKLFQKPCITYPISQNSYVEFKFYWNFWDDNEINIQKFKLLIWKSTVGVNAWAVLTVNSYCDSFLSISKICHFVILKTLYVTFFLIKVVASSLFFEVTYQAQYLNVSNPGSIQNLDLSY